MFHCSSKEINDIRNFSTYSIYIFFFLIITINYFALFHYSLDFWGRWKIGEYLINYEHGFIRRGLIGSFYISIAKVFNFKSVGLTYLIFISNNIILFFIFFIVQKIFLAKKNNIDDVILFFSPAFILFCFYSFQAAYRKEIIIFLSFSILSYALIKNNHFSFKLICLSLFFFIIGLFSHELTIFVLPFFLFQFLKYKDQKRFIFSSIFILFTLISLCINFYFSLDTNHNISITNKICNSLTELGYSQKMCAPLVAGINLSILDYISNTKEYYPFLLKTYIPLLILSLFPVLISNWILNKKNLLIMIIGFFSLLPMFILATDWGRIINVYVFLLFIMILSDEKKFFFILNFKNLKIKFLIIIFYISLWSLPYSFDRPVYSIKETSFYSIKKSLVFFPITFVKDYYKYRNKT